MDSVLLLPLGVPGIHPGGTALVSWHTVCGFLLGEGLWPAQCGVGPRPWSWYLSAPVAQPLLVIIRSANIHWVQILCQTLSSTSRV